MKDTRIRKKSCAMLLIDIQERLAPAMFNCSDAIKVNETLIKSLDALGVPIIYTEQYPKGLGETVPELKKLLDGKRLFEKTVFSAYSSELAAELNSLGVDSVILTGMEAHVCVYQTARDLLENGYKVFLVSDAVSSRVPNNCHNANYLISEMGAVVTNSETILFDLLQKAGTDEFKIVSRLIK